MLVVQMKKIVYSMIAAILSCTAVLAQNYRPPNPDQPNGYHASEAASHYHGNDHLPAQPQNGYHASEARSHSGAGRSEASQGYGERGASWGGRSGGNQEQGRWGSRYGGNQEQGRWGNRYGANQEQGGWGSRYGANQEQRGWTSRYGANQNQAQGWGETTPAEQNFARGLLRRMADRSAQPSSQSSVVGQPDSGVRYSATGGLLDGGMATAEGSVGRMIRNGGGFDTIYAGR